MSKFRKPGILKFPENLLLMLNLVVILVYADSLDLHIGDFGSGIFSCRLYLLPPFSSVLSF